MDDARAIYKNSSVLVLDEAISALDLKMKNNITNFDLQKMFNHFIKLISSIRVTSSYDINRPFVKKRNKFSDKSFVP